MSDKKHSKGRPLTGQALKEFRSKVSKLKSKGLVSKRVQARSQKPTRYMTSKVRGLEDVLSGLVAPVKRSTKVAREYRNAGFRVVNNRLILPREQAVSVRNAHNEWLTLERMTDGGTIERRVILPVTVRNIDNFLSDEDRVDALIHGRRRLAFTYYGNKSLQTFATASALFHWLQHYNVVTGKNNNQREEWENIVLFDLREDRATKWVEEAEAASEASKNNRKRRRPKRMSPHRRQEAGASYTAQPYSVIKARDTERHRLARAAMGEDVMSEVRRKNRERMRVVRGTKRPRK